MAGHLHRMSDSELRAFVTELPKAELHLHIEGTLEPEMMFALAARNGVELPYGSVDELRAAYSFGNLQEFLDLYYAGASVLLHERDFYELTLAYLERVAAEGLVHVEVMFDPQTHTERGVAFADVIGGILRALREGEQRLRVSSLLIMSFLRHLSEEAAFATLAAARPWAEQIAGVGLDSSEVGNPPSKFRRVFAAAAKQGYRLTAHAGEEGPASYVREALDLLDVERIDHGNRALDDDELVRRLVRQQVPLTLCPLSNTALQVIGNMREHPVREFLARGVLATIHSDDPAYFGGYLVDNYVAAAEALELSRAEVVELAANSFRGSWLGEEEVEVWVGRVNEVSANRWHP